MFLNISEIYQNIMLRYIFYITEREEIWTIFCLNL